MTQQKLFVIKKIQRLSSNSKKNPCFLFDDNKKTIDINQVLKKLPNNSNIIFRNYHLNNKIKLELAKEYKKNTQKFSHNFIVGKDFNLANKISAHGIHFSDNDLKNNSLKILIYRRFFGNKNFFFSLAIHNLKSLNFCKILQPDCLFISPIFATTSHHDSRFLGFYNFIKFRHIICKKFKINIQKIAPLGGINLQNLRRLNNIKIAKFGAIDFFNDL